MAQITINIPNGVVSRVEDAFATKFKYTGFLADGTTPQTKAEFAKAQLVKYITNIVKIQESQDAATAAQQAAIANATSTIIIT